MTEAVHLTTLGRTLRRVTVLVGIVFVVLSGVVIFSLHQRPVAEVPVFSPLGDYPTQSVTTEQPIPVGATVGVTGTKCSTANNPIDVIGLKTWRLLDPAGTSVAEEKGFGVRPPGCETKHFENAMPAEVVDRVHQLAAQGQMISRWVLTGQETPIAPQGERAVTKVYRTDNFSIAG